MVGAQEEAFDRCLVAVNEHGDDLAVFCILAGLADHKIAIENAGTAHGLAADSQAEEIVAGKETRIDHYRLVPFLLGIHWQSRCDAPDDRQFPPRGCRPVCL